MLHSVCMLCVGPLLIQLTEPFSCDEVMKAVIVSFLKLNLEQRRSRKSMNCLMLSLDFKMSQKVLYNHVFATAALDYKIIV